jgi:two-component system, NtrC family, nitrogen regulation sensor histidine kinase NtrY
MDYSNRSVTAKDPKKWTTGADVKTTSSLLSWVRERFMDIQKFHINTFVRLLLTCLLACVTIYLVFDSPYWLAGFWTALGCIAMFYHTLGLVNQSEKKLVTFLQSINQSDFSVNFSENRSVHHDLNHAFNQLNDTFRKLRAEKQSEHNFLHIIVETASVPMICFEDDDGKMYMFNNAAKKLFDIPFLYDVKSLWRVDSSLSQLLTDIKDGEKLSLKIVVQGKNHQLSVACQHIIFQGRNLKLAAFHDVSSELATKEAETWLKLFRVLTHEISNSAIPLSTLASFIYELVDKAEAEDRALTREERDDVMTSLRTIDQRSTSLRQFVHNFRNVNQIPEPSTETIRVSELLTELRSLFLKEVHLQQIVFSCPDLNNDFTVKADKDLTLLVLINLVKNAMEAMSNMKHGKLISLGVEKMGHFVNISLSDTGRGISQEDLDQIFIPFFSTKKGGSGIGLSISQQIMQKQKGNISVSSDPGKGSVFTLSFPGGNVSY